MVTERQKRDIQRLMRRIKDAKDEGKSERIIEERTAELYNYMRREGIVRLDG